MRSLVAVVVALPWIVWALLRTLGVELSYPLVALIAFTPYAALTSPVPVVTALLLKRRVVAAVAAVAAVALGFAMVPRAVAGPQPEADGPRLMVMTSNLWLGQAEPARGAADRARARRGRAERAGAAAATDAAFETEQFPHRILEPERGAGGGGLLSRLPLEPTGTPMEGVVTVEGASPVTDPLRAPAPAREPGCRT